MKRNIMSLFILLLSLTGFCDGGAGILTWDFGKGLQGWMPKNFVSYKTTEGGFEGVSKYDCWLTSPRLNLKASDYDQAIIAVSTSIGGSSDLFIASNGRPFSDDRKITVYLSDSKDITLLKFPLHPTKGWEGTIDQLRFDPVNPADAVIRIESIILCKKDKNMLSNGDFEFSRHGTIDGWTLGTDATVVSEGALSGAKCLILKGKGATASTPFADVSWLGTYHLSFLHKGAAGQGVVELRERHGKVVLHQVIDISAAAEWTEQTVLITAPDMAYEGTLSFSGSAGTTAIDKVSVTQGDIGKIKTPFPVEPGWQGAWIWCEENRLADNCTAWLRKSIELPDQPVTSACAQISCDDSVAFYVNGQKVCDTHGIVDAWRKPVVLDIAKYLKPGRNTFLAEARDVTSAQGFITNIAIDVAGTFITVNSGADWEGAVAETGPWKAAAVVGKPPCAPWYALPYRPMGTMPTIKARLGKLPAAVKVGDVMQVPISVEPYSFEGAIGVKAVLKQNGKVLSEGRDVKGLTTKGATATVRVPFSAQPGVASITVKLTGATCTDNLTADIDLAADASQSAKTDYPETKLVQKNGVTWISIDGNVYEPTQVLYAKFDQLQVENGQHCGLRMVDIELDEYGFYEDGFNYDKVDEMLQNYRSAAPDAWLFFNFTLSTRLHKWWLDAHPEARCCHEDGTTDIGGYSGDHREWASYSSPEWRRDFGNALRNLLKHLRNTPYASRVIGIHPSCGISYEWFNWGSQSREFVDYSECGKAAFREWLKAKYGTDAALQAAWNRADVTLAAAPMPASVSRANSRTGRYYDVKTQRDVLDYHEFQNYKVAETIRYFCHIVKEETQGKVLTGTYYGYTCYLFENSFFSQNSGHFDSRYLLDSPDFDFFMAPAAYSRREVGGPGLTMVPEYTHTLNGKIFWGQADLRTHWSPQRNHGNVDSIRGDVECMNREFARALSEGTAVQWYDFSHGWTMGDKRLTQVIEEQIKLVNHYRGTVKDFPEKDYILYVVDENVVGITNVFTPFYNGNLINQQRIDSTLSGVPWRTVLYSDLFKHTDKLLNYKTIVFLTPDKINEQEAAFIRNRVMKDGRTVVFVGNVGVWGAEGLTTQVAETLLGQKFRIDHSAINLNATCTGLWPELKGSTYGTPINVDVQSILLPESLPTEKVLACLTKSGVPAAFYETRGDCKVLWSAAPHFSPAFLRALAVRAELPVVSDSNDNIYAGMGFVGIHAHSSGKKTLKLLGRGTPRELFTNQTWDAGTEAVTLELKQGDTRIFVVE